MDAEQKSETDYSVSQSPLITTLPGDEPLVQKSKNTSSKPILKLTCVLFCSGLICLMVAAAVYFFLTHVRSQTFPYKVVGSYNTSTMISLRLQYTGKDSFYVNETSPIIQVLNCSFVFVDESTVRVHIFSDSLWEIPESGPYPYIEDPKPSSSAGKSATEDRIVDLNITSDGFSWKISRNSTGEVILDSSNEQFLFSELYYQISLVIPATRVAGLGERVAPFWLSNGTYSVWPRDQAFVIDDGEPGEQTYGWHPLLYFQEIESKNFDLLFLRNSNAMDVKLEEGQNKTTVTFKVAGGVIDFYLFLGTEDPSVSVENYQRKMLDGWTLMPFWSMGFSQSRWGYTGLDELKSVVSSYEEADLPLDTYSFQLKQVNMILSLASFLSTTGFGVMLTTWKTAATSLSGRHSKATMSGRLPPQSVLLSSSTQASELSAMTLSPTTQQSKWMFS